MLLPDGGSRWDDVFTFCAFCLIAKLDGMGGCFYVLFTDIDYNLYSSVHGQ